MSVSVNNIQETLQRIIHPSSQKDIVSMGIVRGIEVEQNNIKFELSFPGVNDPTKNSVKKACEQILIDQFGNDYNIDIKISAQVQPVFKKEQPEVLPEVANIVAVASGKGGVGKSTVASNLAVAFAKTGASVGLIDADIFGPSIPKMFGVENAKPDVVQKNGKDLIVPIEVHGVKILSIGFFVNSSDATIWRGPMASNALKQLINDSDWGKLDYLFVDLPPGTSDIHITLSQDVKPTGAIIVSTPQEIALADAIKGISMFQNDSINVPILGLVENMAWFTPAELPDNKYYIFGKDGCKNLAAKLGVPFLGQIPLIQSVRENSDAGSPAVLTKDNTSEYFKNIAETVRANILKLSAN